MEDEDGIERRVKADGTALWYRYGVLHRDDGPAMEYPSGEKRWLQFGELHREDGPAIIRPNGSTQWFRDGVCHREDGPAIERADGTKEWWLNGEHWWDGASILAQQRAEKARAMNLTEDDGVEREVRPDGTVLWYRYGLLHRDRAPAVEYPSGEQRWYLWGRPHREDGPAISRPDGSQEWFRNGKPHREDGPATVSTSGTENYYLNGERWDRGASIVARGKAEKAVAMKMKPTLKPR